MLSERILCFEVGAFRPGTQAIYEGRLINLAKIVGIYFIVRNEPQGQRDQSASNNCCNGDTYMDYRYGRSRFVSLRPSRLWVDSSTF